MQLSNNGFDDHSTYYELNIDRSGIPNIFIHGVGLDNTMWLPQKQYFQNNNVVFYDLLNHGKSKKSYKELKFENFNNQLLQLIKFLNIKKFNLIGFSIGALIAQHFASIHFNRINKLVIIASVFKRSDEQIKKVKNRYKKVCVGKNITKDSIRRWFSQKYLKNNPDIYDYFFNILNRKKDANFLPAYKLFVESDDYYLDFSNFNMPTLIMTGKNEVGSTPEMSEKLHQKIVNSELYIIPNAKHMATFEQEKLVNSKISSFIN